VLENRMKRPLSQVTKIVFVILALSAFGLLRAPWEDTIRDDLVENHLLLPPPAESAIEQMSQSALMGTLGGLRTLVSTFLVLEGFDHFSLKDWEELRNTYQIVTSLEPRDENHWRDIVWHLGINATANMELDKSLPEFERKRRFQQYALEAIDFAERGIQQVPESAIIRQQLAEVYREKLKDNCKTAEVYGDLIGLPGAPEYVRRFHGYFLARCPGKEQEAYDYLMALFREGPSQHLPTLIKEIQKLEELLEIPSPERIRAVRRQTPAQRRASKNSLPGGIVIP